MVQASRDAHRVIRIPRHHEPTRGEHPSHDAGAGLVHVGEDRVVRSPYSVWQQIGECRSAPSCLLDHPHVGEAVDGRQVFICRWFRGDEGIAFQQFEGFAQLEEEPDAQGVEGMFSAKAIVLQG